MIQRGGCDGAALLCRSFRRSLFGEQVRGHVLNRQIGDTHPIRGTPMTRVTPLIHATPRVRAVPTSLAMLMQPRLASSFLSFRCERLSAGTIDALLHSRQSRYQASIEDRR